MGFERSDQLRDLEVCGALEYLNTIYNQYSALLNTY